MSGPLVCRCRVQPPSLEAAGQSHLARLLPFSPLSFPRERESSAPKPVTRPWISRLRGNDGNREVENPNAIALAFRGEREKKAKQPATLPRCVHAIAPARPPIEEGSGERDKGVSCCPRPLSCARVWGACGTINLSSDDALDVLQISCRSRARSRQGFSRGWAEAHPHPGPYRADTSCGSHRWRDFFSLSALQGQGNRIWRDCCLSLPCHSRGSGNPAPQNPSLAPGFPLPRE